MLSIGICFTIQLAYHIVPHNLCLCTSVEHLPLSRPLIAVLVNLLLQKSDIINKETILTSKIYKVKDRIDFLVIHNQ